LQGIFEVNLTADLAQDWWCYQVAVCSRKEIWENQVCKSNGWVLSQRGFIDI